MPARRTVSASTPDGQAVSGVPGPTFPTALTAGADCARTASSRQQVASAARPVGTLFIQRTVGSFAQVVGGVLGLELRQPHRHRTRRGLAGKHGVDMRQSLGDLVLAEVDDHAHELITPEADDQVVPPELGLQRPGDVMQQPVPSGMAALVVDALELVDVDERHDQRPTAWPD